VITENSFLQEGRFSVSSTHRQAVKNLGTSLKAFAFSTGGLIEAFYKKDHPFLIGVQWHPESIPESMLSMQLFTSFIKASDESK
jgi:putative glutamine amidotransferase